MASHRRSFWGSMNVSLVSQVRLLLTTAVPLAVGAGAMAGKSKGAAPCILPIYPKELLHTLCGTQVEPVRG